MQYDEGFEDFEDGTGAGRRGSLILGEDDEEGGISLAEQDDVREDPIIPEPEREEGDEDD